MSASLGLGRLPTRIGLETVQSLSITSLQLATGVFCCAMGVLMLVAPHQFNWPVFAWLQGQLTWWGLGFLAAGVGLLIILTLVPGFGLKVVVHLWAGGLLLALAAGFVRTGVWSGMAPYLVLGLGTAFAPFLARPAFRRTWLHGEAFALLDIENCVVGEDKGRAAVLFL